MSKVTRAIILAAGLGTRLKSLTQHTPKALMQVAGEPAIVHVIRRLVAQGVHDIAINLHHHASQVREVLEDGSRYHARLYYSFEPELLDSGGGVRTAMDLLPDSGLIVVHNADIMADIDVQRLARYCPQSGCALALVANPKHHSHGDFALTKQGLLTKQGAKYTFSGVSVWHEAVLQHYPSQQAFSLVQPIQACMETKRGHGFLHQDAWFDIGRHRDLVQANRQYS